MTARRAALLLPLLGIGGCTSLGDLWSSADQGGGADLPLEERPIEEPLSPNTFLVETPEQGVIGEPQVVFASESDTLSDLAREYGLGYDEIVAANPEVDPWLPGEGTPVLLPTQYVLPGVERTGVILNIATKRLFFFPRSVDGGPQEVLTYPIGIGRVGWETPLGDATVVAKARDPQWWVPASVRKEHAEMGDPLPAVVPPGPDNPLGHRVLQLDMPGYLIHGTNAPYGVGMRVSHGCIRLYPENIEHLFDLVEIGESVTIINEPFQFGYKGDALYFEAHAPLEDDEIGSDARLAALLESQVDANGAPLNSHLSDHVHELAESPRGIPVGVFEFNPDEFMARARVVHNTVAEDPNAPTLTEVREMMEEVEAEIAAEKEGPAVNAREGG